ncbi:MAG: 50S ribosomal protein L21 [Methylobacteriaceae bacterium]|nr:50S ribosomal protein L21 [Methylobacteriaceae bacterium]
MFAVIKTGGKQFRIAANDVITVPKLEGEPGADIQFDEVLVLTREGGVELGAPAVAGAAIAATIVEQTRGPKVIAFKKRRRQNSRRKRGHRQDLTVVRIGAFTLNGETLAAPVQAEPALAESASAE